MADSIDGVFVNGGGFEGRTKLEGAAQFGLSSQPTHRLIVETEVQSLQQIIVVCVWN